MDYHHDGTNDVVGCGFDGFIEWFRGQGGTRFASGIRLRDKNGKDIHDGQYWGDEEKKWMAEKDGQLLLHALLIDWDDDADLDILLAGRSGRLSLRINQGTAAAPAFSPDRTPVLVEGKPYGAAGGSTPNPAFVDWDGDGLLDLIIGGGFYISNSEADSGAWIYLRETTATR